MPLLAWLDIRTLVACQCLLLSVFAVMLLGMRRLYPQLRGVGSIALGFALAAPATLLLATRNVVPHLLSVVGGNEFVIISYLFLYRGILRFFQAEHHRAKPAQFASDDGKDHFPLLCGVAALTAVLVFYFTEIHDRPALRVLAATSVFALARILMALRLFRAAAGRPHLLLFGASLTGFALLTLGDALFVALHGVPGDFLARGSLQTITLMLSVIFVCSNGIFYLAMFAYAIAEQVQEQARLDFLTGAFNREGIQMALTVEIARHRRRQLPLSILLIDLDRFKAINDRHGHAAGDHALLTVARSIHSVVREYDNLGRFGGDEFLLLLPETTGEQAMQTAARIREALTRREQSGQTPTRLPLSIGVAEWVDDEDIDSLLQRADRALYQAKRSGRDCARLAIPGQEVDPMPNPTADTPPSAHHAPASHSTSPLYPNCAENPVLQGGDVERGQRSCPQLGVCCCSMYWRMIEMGAPPQLP
ncbi:MAG TPA: GGDEF domain-containing protein, partial [Granulicella sp.]|nr:GGDEF domain-containing protein [Granulicella sp.]